MRRGEVVLVLVVARGKLFWGLEFAAGVPARVGQGFVLCHRWVGLVGWDRDGRR